MASQNTGKFKKVFGIIGVVLFFLSYLPFIPLIEVGIHGVQSGLFGGPYIYGFDAVADYFLWLCIVPIYPICILYQLIFGIAYIRKHKVLKIVTIAVVASLVTAILAAGIYYEVKKKELIDADRELIIEYLSDKYGEEVTSDITITLTYYDDRQYRVTSPVLPEDGYFFVYTSEDDDFYDDLFKTYMRWDETFEEDFEDYINEQYDMPDNMSLQSVLDSVYFGDFTYGDDHDELFESAQYRVTGIEVDEGELTDEDVLEILNGVWEEQIPKLSDVMGEDYLCLYIKENGEHAFYITIYPDSAAADISIYTGRGYQVLTQLNGARIDLS